MGVSKDPEIIAVWKKYREDLNITFMQLSKINSENVLEFHAVVSLKAVYIANRMVGVIGKLFNYAKVKGYYSGDNPAAKLKKKLNKEIQENLLIYMTLLIIMTKLEAQLTNNLLIDLDLYLWNYHG